MKTKFIKVPTIERNPQEAGQYSTEIGDVLFSTSLNQFLNYDGDVMDIEWWIEEAIDREEELLEWKESASKVMNNIDLQKVGKLINVPLGADVSTEILPFIEKSVEIKKLLIEEIYPVLVEMDKYETFQKIQKLLNAR